MPATFVTACPARTTRLRLRRARRAGRRCAPLPCARHLGQRRAGHGSTRLKTPFPNKINELRYFVGCVTACNSLIDNGKYRFFSPSGSTTIWVGKERPPCMDDARHVARESRGEPSRRHDDTRVMRASRGRRAPEGVRVHRQGARHANDNAWQSAEANRTLSQTANGEPAESVERDVAPPGHASVTGRRQKRIRVVTAYGIANHSRRCSGRSESNEVWRPHETSHAVTRDSPQATHGYQSTLPATTRYECHPTASMPCASRNESATPMTFRTAHSHINGEWNMSKKHDNQLWKILLAKFDGDKHEACVEYERLMQGIEDGDVDVCIEYEMLFVEEVA